MKHIIRNLIPADSLSADFQEKDARLMVRLCSPQKAGATKAI
jgi:hypothetical protein